MPLNQKYFEIRDVAPLQGRAWTPLRQATQTSIDATDPDIVSNEDFIGIATAAIHAAKRADAEKVDWTDLGLGPHRAGVEEWGYRSVDVFRTWTEEVLGINLVIAQHVEETGREMWHLHPDLIVALHLQQEEDRWYRPEEGWIEVVRLKRDAEGKPVLLEIKTEFLVDYLAARDMALYCSSYRERIVVTLAKPAFSWHDDAFSEEVGCDRREGIVTDASYPDPDDSFWTRGAIWRTEWVDAGKASVRVRGDKDPHTTTFALSADGARVVADRLAGAMTWLYFEPALVSTLLRHRGARLHWHSQETGGLGATSSTIHFGVNRLGLITVFAKDIGQLPSWEQRLWSAHNVTPDGGVSRELFAAQMEVTPAATTAPEKALPATLEGINAAFTARYGLPLLRSHEAGADLLRRAHRFRAAEPDGLLELSKELTRLFIERIDVGAITAQLTMAKGASKLGSLKAFEKLIATLRPDVDAQTMMAPLFGIYDLRLADAHLGSSRIASGKARAGVDETEPAAMQGRQLLQGFVDTLQRITDVLP
ncbi:hypothetical protein [Neorhizobium galegae]|uniref:hypothetical protein n=1 Tax=Neorhizobium galegae TaxID=399 RepID=UPI00062136DC|nr:hypothetical protein [Neorhizobium galegae]KAB1125572.1 hypothetical protein F4V90_00125 [Neorhizobium galegae]MCQ1805831.1 hypothetical protein [Neorhizobium galegae]CDZ59593.1 Hypothetical protein NGAL_HAMBI2566_35860 [Neorhizobium galegae bv. orientalis]